MHMKNSLLFAACLILIGCGRQDKGQREILARLDAITSQLASNRTATVRWAFANKREIDSLVFQWSRSKSEDLKKGEALSPEIEQQVRQYESLHGELIRKQADSLRARLPTRLGAPEASGPDADYLALSNRVREAKAPIADVIDRRNRQAADFRDQYSAEKLVAEYARDKFDLVVDSSNEQFSRSSVLYRTNGEVLDITDGVIKLLKEKTNQ